MPKNPWARNPWFESVAVAQRRARQRLPSSVYGALVAGSERGQSSHDNTAAFAELGFAPHVVGPSTERLLGTTVMGQDVSLPVLISPTGVQAVHPDGEVAMARAAAARDTVMGLSSFASRPVEEVVAANPKTLFQIYWMGSRDLMLERLQRARGAGAKGLIATLDWSFSMGRDWGSPEIPERLDLATMVRFAPQVLIRPRWLWDFARSGQIPDLTAPNLARDGGDAPTFFGAYYEWMQTAAPTWDDVEWLRASWDGPFMLKGVCRIDDARRAVAAGCTAISVSNHGGNNLDGTPAPIRMLGPIADAVGRRDRGAPRRRCPSWLGCGQGALPGCPGRDDRSRQPLGTGRQRAGGGRERPGHPARWHRVGHAGPQGAVDPRAPARAPDHPGRLPPQARSRTSGGVSLQAQRIVVPPSTSARTR